MPLTKKAAEEIIERKKQLLVSIGITEPGRIEDILRETYEEFTQYFRVQRLRKRGNSYPQISKKTGVDKFKVFNWMSKDRLPTLLAKERFFSKDLLRIDESTTDDVIKLLAVYSASKISPKQIKFKTKLPNRTSLEAVLDPFFNVFSTVPYIWEDEHGIEFDFCSKPFLEYYNEQTRNNRAMPWKLLKTKEQKVMYFQYFFLKKGFFKYRDPENQYDGSLTFSFLNNENLLYEFAVLLSDIGLNPNVNSRGVEFTDYVSLKQMNDWCLCPDKKKKLGRLVIGKILSPDTHHKIIHGFEVFFEKDKPELAQEYDIAAWANFVYVSDKKEQASEPYNPGEQYVLADNVFNMYVPDRFLDDPERIKTRQLQIYRVLRSNPQFFQFMTLENNSFYIERNRLDFIESLIGSIYRKERRFNDAVELTGRLN